MPALSKRPLRAEKAIRVVAATLRENRGVLNDGLTELFRPYLGEDEASPDFSRLPDLMARCLEDTHRTLLSADRTKLDELADDSGLRKRRDALARDLYRELVALKGAIRSGHGAEGVAILGFARRLGRDPVVVLRQMQRIVANLGNPERPLPAPKVAGTGVRPEEITRSLEPKVEALRDVLRRLDAELRETDTAQLGKNAALEQYRRVIRSLAGVAVAFFRLIGRDDLADRIPPVVRRSFRRGRRAQAPAPPTSPASEARTVAP